MHAADQNHTPSDAKKPIRTGRILVVEDDSIMARIATSLLRAEGHSVQTAASGLAALDLVAAEPPDLILLDYMMPGMNGEETCRRLKGNPDTQRIPVIMVTAEDSTELVRNCLGLGAADYVRKPYAPSELMARVRTHLELSWTERDLHEWKQRVSADLRLGGLLQKDLASAPPLLGRFLQARAEFRPSLHVGGDFLDMLDLPNGRCVFYVGDTAGHGVAAALVSSMLKSFLAELLRNRPNAAPFELCNALHVQMNQRIDMPSVYATFLIAVGDAQSGRFEVLNCGHPWPLLEGGSGGSERPAAIAHERHHGGMPIGFPVPGEPYKSEQQVSVQIPPGGRLLVYTDGLNEAVHRSTKELLGLEALPELFAKSHSPGAILNQIEANGYLLEDDCSLVMLRATDPAEVLLQLDLGATSDLAESAARELEVIDDSLSESELERLQLLLLEHLGNIFEHSQVQAEERVEIQLQLRGEVFELLICDPGIPWRSPNNAELPSDPMAESGRGLAIINTIVLSAERYRNGRRNVALYRLSRVS